MPIDYSRYPDDWDERVKRIMKRAGGKCENCGFEHDQLVYSVKLNDKGCREWYSDFHEAKKAAIESGWEEKHLKPPEPIIKPVKVILTTAHLDHDEENAEVLDERLMALCQLCHLRYDAKEKYRRVMKKNT